jgi:phage/plasmid-like protein (TIGR03299 family)
MAHEVESMAYMGDVPWHGLGVPIIDPQDAVHWDRFLVAAGADWEVEKIETVTADTHEPTGHFAIRRKTDGKVLGNVGRKFNPLQNADAFKWFQPFLDSGMAKFECGGSLRDGAIIWALAKVDGVNATVRKGDPISSYILLSHGHDGFHCVRAGFTPIRVVCMNTLRMATGDVDSQLVRFKHTAKLQDNLTALSDVMDLAVQEFHATVEQYKMLADKGINQADVEKYVKKVFDINEEEDNEISTKTENKLARIYELTYNGRGNTGKTYWDAYNGITEHLSYEAGRGESTRLYSLWFGPGAELNKKALEVGVELAQAA